MKQKISLKVAIPVMATVLILLIIFKACGLLTVTSGARLGFVGNSTFHSFSGRYLKLSGSTSHTLSPSDGSTSIQCEIKTESGSIQVLIIDKADGTVLCEKEISENETFEVPASGKVKIKLTSKGHSGSYSFKY